MNRKIHLASATLLAFTALSAHALTLEQVLARVVKTNPNIAIAKYAINESRYALYRSESGFMPKLNATFRNGRERSRNSSVLALGVNENILNRRERTLSMAQNLFTGGSNLNEFYQQRHLLNAARFDYVSRGQATLLEAVEAYLDVLKNDRLLHLAMVNVNNHKRTEHKVELMYKGGAGNLIDIELSKGRTALAESRYQDSVGLLKQSKARFYAVVGMLPKEKLEWPVSINKYLPKTERDALRLAIEKHPAIKSRLAQTKAAGSAVAVAMGKYYPQVNFNFSYSDNQNLDGVPGPNRDWQGGIEVNMNFFNGFSDQSEISAARAKWLSARQDIEVVRRQIFENVSSTWHSLEANRAEIKELIKHVSKSIEVVKGYKLQFNLGKRQLFNVLDAQNELYRAQVQLVAAEFDAKVDTYRLLASMGQLTTLHLHIPASV